MSSPFNYAINWDMNTELGKCIQYLPSAHNSAPMAKSIYIAVILIRLKHSFHLQPAIELYKL